MLWGRRSHHLGLSIGLAVPGLEDAVSERTQPIKSGVELITEERNRQEKEKWYWPSHDDRHTRFTLTRAAMSYAAVVGAPDREAKKLSESAPTDDWPVKWKWKPSDDPIRNLVKAGALIAAEIDRLLRLNEREKLKQTQKQSARGLAQIVLMDRPID
jgi:hypothetical protein